MTAKKTIKNKVKKKASKAKKKQGKGKKKGAKLLPLMVISIILLAIIALPTTILLMIGLLPTFVLFIVDKTKSKSRTISVGALNLAACTPFLFDLWQAGNAFNVATDLILSPMTIIVMYMGAVSGYCIDWALSGVSSGILYKQAEMRLGDIKKKQKVLVQRWGKKVTGEIPLSKDGFPLEKADSSKD